MKAFLKSAMLLLAVALAAPQAQTFVRKPFLQLGKPTSASVCWKLSAAAPLTVRFGTDSLNLNRSVTGANIANTCVSLDTLAPSTKYHYEVYNGSTLMPGGTPQYIKTAPPVGTRQKYTFWLLGDFGVGVGHADYNTHGIASQRVRDAFVAVNGGPHVDGVLFLGDIAYENGTEAQVDAGAFALYPNIMSNSFVWPAMGNHEAVTSSGAAYLGAFALPSAGQAGGVASNTEYYYSYNYGNVHFIVLEFEVSSRATTGAQYLWLQQDLQSASAQNADWIVVYSHHMPYTCCDHNSETEAQLVNIRYNFLPLLEQYGVDMFFAGHSHDYERSWLLDSAYSNSATSTTQSSHYTWYSQNRSRILVDSSSGNPDISGPYRKQRGGNNGTVYAVVGSGGKLEINNTAKHPLMYVRHLVQGSMILDIQDSVATARFYDTTRTLRDKFQIIKPVSSTGLKQARRPVKLEAAPKFSQAGRRFQFKADNSLVLYVYAPDGSLLLQETPRGSWDIARTRLPAGEYYFRYGNDFKKVSLP
jgi:hypothetical protein